MLVHGLKNLEVSDIELNIKENMYAFDAFKLIEKKYEGEEIFFIMGADNFINIIKWKNSNLMLKNYKYIILDRENIDINQYIHNNIEISKYKDNIKIIPNQNYLKCNSTEFRKRVKEEQKYNQDIVPDNVIDYIIENNLYK